MPSSSTSSTVAHVLKNVFLILFSAFFTPLCTWIAFLSSIVSPFTKASEHIKLHRQWRQKSSSTFRPRTVLVTGVGTAKGLALARAFYRAGHRVIGADFEPYLIPVPGHFSTSIEIFYRLSKPDKETGTAKYIQDILSLILKEKAELWISCSDVIAADDAEAAEVVGRRTKCKSIQLSHSCTGTLTQAPSFTSKARTLGLHVPESHIVTSETEALSAMYPTSTRFQSSKNFLITSLRSNAAPKVLSQFPNPQETKAEIRTLNPTPFNPFFVQEQVTGIEYSTHTLILKGKITAFVACPSTPNAYTALPYSSALSQAMLLYTKAFISSSEPMTAHLSLTFRVPESASLMGENTFGASDSQVKELMGKIYAISANPGVSPAIVLFADESEDLAEMYLSVLPSHEPLGIANGHRDSNHIIVPKPTVPTYYWVGQDIVAGIFLSLFAFLRGDIGLKGLRQSWTGTLGNLLGCRDATWELWDPWPFWWMYVGYWPAVFLSCLWEGRRWRECDVSEGRLIEDEG
ncbi:hypothetical protein LSUE1_G002042 [Lachnellula suecica]|uniref:Uncharacterized protein n=1 Tax=Lachnellula suecica TaxID=602035 RepID=A0A8T9CEK4_9HELO|nr:hypothetical protein LSUE1_G002042 [Lachnellula suecica]